MEIPTSDSLSLEKLMVKESIPGQMARYMMVSGTKVLSKDMVFGKVYRTILTLENGTHPRLMATASIRGLTETSMRASGKCALSTGMELTHSYQVTSIPESTMMASLKERESIDGLMDRFIQENFIKGLSMEKVDGKARKMVWHSIIMMENIRMTRRVVTECIHG